MLDTGLASMGVMVRIGKQAIPGRGRSAIASVFRVFNGIEE